MSKKKSAPAITIMVFTINIFVIFSCCCSVNADIALNSSNWLGSSGAHYWYIDQPGAYFLDTDGDTFSTDSNIAIRIAGSDITVDGRNKKITSSTGYPTNEVDEVDEFAPNMYGVRVNAGVLSTNVVVKNIQVEKKYFGIIYEYVNNGIIENNSTTDNNYGIYLWKVEKNNVIDNISSNNQHSGITFDGNDGGINRENLISGNTISGNGEFGIVLWLECPNTTIADNSIDDSGNSGIVVDKAGSDHAIIQNNTSINNNIHGLYVRSSFNEINDNTFSDNTEDGILLVTSSQNNITGNTVTGNLINGIWLENASTNNQIAENTSANNGEYGIALMENCPNNVITDNVVNSNASIGITIRPGCDYTTVQNNTSSKNFYGLDILSSFNEIDNNIFTENTSVGIRLELSSQNTITNNTSSTNKTTGIWLQSGSTDNLISENTFAENGEFGIAIMGNDCQNNTITNNTINNNASIGVTLRPGCNYTTVQNNTSTNNFYGLNLQSSFNQIVNNIFNNSTNVGIRLESSTNNTITNNISSNNIASGIWLESGSTDNLISENTFAENSEHGVALLNDCPNNTISDNFINNNVLIGILLQTDCNYTTVKNNTTTNNLYGLNIKSSFNQIDKNIISQNVYYGILLEEGNEPPSDNTITDNFVTDNNNWGIFFSGRCDNQIIFNNYFKNSKNVFLGTTSSCNCSTALATGPNIIGGPYLGGNYWSKPDNTGFSQLNDDYDLDGICDTEYNLSSNNIDYFPLHSVSPIVSTEAATAVGYDTATFNGTIKSGGSSTAVIFEYGLTTDYTNTITVSENPFTNLESKNVSISVIGLESEISYHYRIKASNSNGVSFGDDKIAETTSIETMYISKDDSLCSGNAPCISSIQDGIDAAAMLQRIKITQGEYAEEIVLDMEKEIILQGGHDEAFSLRNGTTKIFSLTITEGKVICSKIDIGS